jgi:hypothetical protein
MPLPDYIVNSAGTAIIWGEAGATGLSLSVTKTMSLDALASGSAQMGASADLGANYDQEYYVVVIVESGSAPTAGRSADLYFACSHDNTNWPAGVTGSDGAWPADGNEDEWAKQLGVPVAAVISTNDATTVQIGNAVTWRPPARYVAPVLDNNWDVAFRDEATATNNDSRIVLVPKRITISDS